MNERTLREAMREAKRFLKLAAETEKLIRETDGRYWIGTKSTGATKRASMDLSRALTEMRRAC